ncbi:MAG: hypothetical protein U9N07_01780 [Euryarchaeota archaeon]|nr:hypothetical protein [Euryarchaeota archaeon]
MQLIIRRSRIQETGSHPCHGIIYFTPEDLCSAFHLSEIGVSTLIHELLDNNRIVDMSSSVYGRRYTKMRA